MVFHEIFQIILASFCGFLIGFERQFHGSQAGIRTYTLVCIGSCLFGITSTHANGAAFYTSVADPTRIAAQVVSGIGFLCAGIIFKDQSKVHGLTTAANIWVAASIGLSISFEMIALPVFTTILIIFILSLNHMDTFKNIQNKIENIIKKLSNKL
jgi:putative Mg2+ transporter-C (MgtC) family protein